MFKYIIFLLTLSISLNQKCFSQKIFEKYSKTISIGIGGAYLPSTKVKPQICEAYFNNYGPSFTAKMDFSKSEINNLEFHLKYSIFGSTLQDTILISPYTSDPNSYMKIYDLSGSVRLGSIGGSWKHHFGQNQKNRPYIIIGGEVLYKYRNIQRGLIESNTFAGVHGYINGPLSVLSFNVFTGLGIRHVLSDNVSMYEQLDLSYMIIDRQFDSFGFAPGNFAQEFLLNLSIGFSFNLKMFSFKDKND